MISSEPEPNWWIEPVARTVERARCDAEHYQPRYDSLEAAIRDCGQWRSLGELVTYCRRGLQPEYIPDGEVLVVNSQHVGPHLINVSGAERTSLDFWDRKPAAQVKLHDVVMNSTGLGTIGRVNCVLHKEKTVVDNHVTILRVKPGEIDPLFLAVFLNSSLGREQTYRWQSGSSGQLEIYPVDIQRFVVPIPEDETQELVAAKLRTAYEHTVKANAAAADASDRVVSLIKDSY
jgi:hypothetical protein